MSNVCWNKLTVVGPKETVLVCRNELYPDFDFNRFVPAPEILDSPYD